MYIVDIIKCNRYFPSLRSVKFRDKNSFESYCKILGLYHNILMLPIKKSMINFYFFRNRGEVEAIMVKKKTMCYQLELAFIRKHTYFYISLNK